MNLGVKQGAQYSLLKFHIITYLDFLGACQSQSSFSN